MQKILIHIIIIGLFSGCSIYRAEVEQGNLVTQEMIGQVRPGMDKQAVLKVLGTPLVKDPFHHDRWDYYHSLKREGKMVEKSLLTLYFSDNRLSRIEGKPTAK